MAGEKRRRKKKSSSAAFSLSIAGFLLEILTASRARQGTREVRHVQSSKMDTAAWDGLEGSSSGSHTPPPLPFPCLRAVRSHGSRVTGSPGAHRAAVSADGLMHRLFGCFFEAVAAASLGRLHRFHVVRAMPKATDRGCPWIGHGCSVVAGRVASPFAAGSYVGQEEADDERDG